MRLWHYKLIPALPEYQLMAQWRELCSIARNIAVEGSPKQMQRTKQGKAKVNTCIN